jgi:hypothetical protein
MVYFAEIYKKNISCEFIVDRDLEKEVSKNKIKLFKHKFYYFH